MKTSTRKNFMKVVRQMTDTHVQQGKVWYNEAHNFCLSISKEYGVDFTKVCGIVSALSPANEWENNKTEAHALIFALVNKLDHYEISFKTYGQNVAKAVSIFDSAGIDIETFFNQGTGYKTHAFYRNILNPDCKDYVTIDRHAYSVLKGLDR